VNATFPDANLVEVKKAVTAFLEKVDELFGYHSDSTFGFRATLAQLALAEMERKKRSPNVDFDSERVSFGSGHRKHPATRILHETTVRELRLRNSDRGMNHVRAGQNFIVLLYSFWEHEYRPLLAKALGSQNDLQIRIMGDVRRLRRDIIHHGGILQEETLNRLELLRLKRGVDLVSGLRFTKLSAQINRSDSSFRTCSSCSPWFEKQWMKLLSGPAVSIQKLDCSRQSQPNAKRLANDD
jgi:hypothetical protein